MAIPLGAVAEVSGASTPRLVPQIPLGVGGVLNLRGEPLPVVDGGELFGLTCEAPRAHTLVLERELARVGVLVGLVTRIDREFRPGPAAADAGLEAPADSELVRWVHCEGALVGLVDPEGLFRRVTELLRPRAVPRPDVQTLREGAVEGGEGCLTAF